MQRRNDAILVGVLHGSEQGQADHGLVSRIGLGEHIGGEQKPMQRFGSFIVRAALRRAFREVIGDRVEPDEDAPKVAAAEAAKPRDWEAEIDTAPDVDAVHALHTEMKRARAVTPQLEAQLRNRLQAAAWAPAEESPKPGRPQDHLPPANRAARRAKSKGRRK